MEKKTIQGEIIKIPEELRPSIDGDGPLIEFDSFQIIKFIPEKGDPYFLLKFMVTRGSLVLAAVHFWGKPTQPTGWRLTLTSVNIFTFKNHSEKLNEFIYSYLDKFSK